MLVPLIWQICQGSISRLPLKGNGGNDIKGNLRIRPLNDVLALANSHHEGMLTASLELYISQRRRKSSHGRES